MLHFNVNVSMLWRDVPFMHRFQHAQNAGFGAVEFLWPRGENLDDVAEAINSLGLRVVLHNMDAGDIAAGERGYANDPARMDEWRQMFQAALGLAWDVQCPRINCLVGNDLGTIARDEQLAVVEENFRWALDSAESNNITLMVEPLNLFDTPNYLLGNTPDGVAFVQRFDSPYAQLQYDAYHMQRMEGYVAQTSQRHIAAIGHIQIADDPGRHEPGTGAIHWREVFAAIEESGYNGYVGLEYLASTTPEESFKWLPEGKRSGCAASELNL